MTLGSGQPGPERQVPHQRPGLAERLRSSRREAQLAVRSLSRSPGFTLVVFFTLALGTASTTGVFSVLDAVVLRPLEYPDANRLVTIMHPATVPGSGERTWGLSPGGYFQFAEKNRSLESIGIYRSTGLTVTGNEYAELARTAQITASTFSVLSARPFAGRLLTDADDVPGAARVAVISHAYLERRFGGDTLIIGRNLETSVGPFEIVGVTEPELALPLPSPFASAADLSALQADIWLPLQLNAAGPFYNNHPYVGIGRLKPDVSLASAQTDIATIFSHFTEALPGAYSEGFVKSYNFRVHVDELQRSVLGPTLPRTLWMLLGAVVLVLGIAAANVANLFLVRLEVRRRESAIRAALGADRVHMATHHLSETLLLCTAGSIAGLALAAAGLRAMLLVAPTDIPRLASASLNGRAALVALVIALSLGVLLGMLPLARRGVDMQALRSSGRGTTPSPRQLAVRNALVIGQIAMALTLLSAAGLMLRSFDALRRVEPGFDTASTLVFEISLPYDEYAKRSRAIEFHREMQSRLRELPGVTSVGSISAVPLSDFGTGCTVVFRENRPYGPDEQTPCVSTPSATPGLFETLQIEVDGRVPTWNDVDARTQAVVVTRALAEHLWPGENAIGKGIGSSGPDADTWYRVTGVANNINAEALDAPYTEAVFYPASGLQEDDERGALNDHAYMVRTKDVDPMSLLPAVRRIAGEINPRVPIVSPRTMNAVLESSIARTTFLMMLLGLAAGVALLLSAVGIYGVISYIVTQRRPEIGVRMALGASVAQVVRMVLLQSMKLALYGVVLGLAGVYIVSRLMGAMLFGVEPNDPVVTGVVAMLLLAASAVASLLPARRAALVDPVEALREG